MSETEIKKSGNKIYSLGQKIQESKKAGMINRIPDYVEKLDQEIEKLKAALPEIRKNLDC